MYAKTKELDPVGGGGANDFWLSFQRGKFILDMASANFDLNFESDSDDDNFLLITQESRNSPVHVYVNDGVVYNLDVEELMNPTDDTVIGSVENV